MHAFSYIDDDLKLNNGKWTSILKKGAAFFAKFPFLKDPAFTKLTTIQQRFIMAYTLKDMRGFTLYDCYRYAVNDVLHDKMAAATSATRNLSHPDVKPFIEKINWMRVEAMGFTNERIIEEETAIAYSDITEYLDAAGLVADLKELPGHIRRAIKSFDIIETEIPVKDSDPILKRQYRVKLWDKGASLHRMEKVKGMHKDNINLNTNNTNLNITAEMKPQEAAKLYTQFLKGEDNA